MEIDYYDYEDTIKAFWRCNIKQDYEDFNFVEAFESFKGRMWGKLAEHGLLSFEEYAEQEEEDYSYGVLDELSHSTDHIQITSEELKRVIQNYKYERYQEQFKDYDELNNIKKVYFKVLAVLGDSEGISRKDKVLLFDEIIHLEHTTGELFDVDIEDLRIKFEESLK